MARVDGGQLKLTSRLIDERSGDQVAEVFVISSTYQEARDLLGLAVKNALETLPL